jgi:soluble lytic murein transglycosylase
MRCVKLAAFPAVRRGLTVAAVVVLAGSAVPAEAYLEQNTAALSAAALPAVLDAETAARKFVAEPLSASDSALLLEAHGAADRNEWATSRKLAARSTDAIGRRTITWRYLLDESTSPGFDELAAFLEQHPNWPRQDALIRRAETLMPRTFTAEQVIAWYAARPPLGKTGMVRLGQALIDTGKEADGRQLIASAWVDNVYTEAGELNFLELYAAGLSQQEHAERFQHLLARGALADATRQMARLEGTDRRVAQASLALRRTPEKALRAHAGLAAVIRDDPRYRFEYARQLRRSDRPEEAWQVMAQLSPETLVDPVMGWNERSTMARDALQAQRPELAYALASQHSLVKGAEFAEAEFLSGWIALTRLDRAARALHHFERMTQSVARPISRARALYWTARAQDALRQPGLAHAAYEAAAKHGATFYGQLSRDRLQQRGVVLPAASAAQDGGAAQAVQDDERVHALFALESLGQWQLVQTFAAHLASEYEDPASLTLFADLVARSGNRKNALRIAKLAAQKDVLLLRHSAPLLDLPQAAAATGVEKALVLGLTRQESEFDPSAGSPVGASGLMQLMPRTAEQVARTLDITYSAAKLHDPATNLLLGSAYLAELLERWSGSYVLSIASYNAGPGNVNKWLRLNGDPRKDVDPVDWIEAIPFAETRNYVQRVLENTQLYRNRLAGAAHKMMLAGDLERGADRALAGKDATLVVRAGF